MSKKTVLKLGLICAILYGVWRLWQNDAAINALIMFGTAGIVPGTDIELTPEQVYIVLGGILLLAIMGIFAKEVARDVRAVRRAWHNWRQKGGTLEAAEAVTLAIVAAATANARQAKVRQRVSANSEQPVIVIPVALAPSRRARLWLALRPKLIIALGATLEFLLKTADRMAVWASRASMRVYGKGVQVWLWAEPYLRRFDTWLEQKIKSNKDLAAMLHFWSELRKVLRAGITELRARLNRIPPASGD